MNASVARVTRKTASPEKWNYETVSIDKFTHNSLLTSLTSGSNFIICFTFDKGSSEMRGCEIVLAPVVLALSPASVVSGSKIKLFIDGSPTTTNVYSPVSTFSDSS